MVFCAGVLCHIVEQCAAGMLGCGGLGMVRWGSTTGVLSRYAGVWWVRYGEVCRGMDSHWAVTLRH